MRCACSPLSARTSCNTLVFNVICFTLLGLFFRLLRLDVQKIAYLLT